MQGTVQVLERGWLSANNIVFTDAHSAVVVDTGYHSHSAQTLALVQAALNGRRLDRIINTHLHSDHCGGNAALHAHYGCEIWIPPGEAAFVAAWDEAALSYRATGQHCPRFAASRTLIAGEALTLGGEQWVAVAAPGHDPASLILHCPATRTLISADALWSNGFGAVFPELAGEPGFDDVAATLDAIEALNVGTVIPGHGAAFTDVAGALVRARSRLNSFIQAPDKHRWHGLKVLVVFWLMDVGSASLSELQAHLGQAHYVAVLAARLGGTTDAVLAQVLDELVAKGSLRCEDGRYIVGLNS